MRLLAYLKHMANYLGLKIKKISSYVKQRQKLETNKMSTRIDKLNARNYATHYRIAENALKTLAKIKDMADESMQKCGDTFSERPDFDYIFFQPSELIRITYDYTFAALENFLEHWLLTI
jgi:L-rhamnose mutarotase